MAPPSSPPAKHESHSTYVRRHRSLPHAVGASGKQVVGARTSRFGQRGRRRLFWGVVVDRPCVLHGWPVSAFSYPDQPGRVMMGAGRCIVAGGSSLPRCGLGAETGMLFAVLALSRQGLDLQLATGASRGKLRACLFDCKLYGTRLGGNIKEAIFASAEIRRLPYDSGDPGSRPALTSRMLLRNVPLGRLSVLRFCCCLPHWHEVSRQLRGGCRASRLSRPPP